MIPLSPINLLSILHFESVEFRTMPQDNSEESVDDTWLNNEDASKLDGFNWRAGVVRDTTGVFYFLTISCPFLF